MKKIEKLYNTKFLNAFLLIHPFIDIVTSFMMRYLDISITIGVICRTLFLIYSLLYLIFINKDHKKFKIIFFCLLFIYFVCFFITNCFNSFWFDELNSFVKYMYYPIVLIFMFEIIVDSEPFETSFKVLIIINLLIILAQFIGYTIPSYGFGKIGNSGWFYSANELSVIFSMLFPVAFYKFIKKTNIINTIILIITIMSMMIIGTKTTFLAVFITLVAYIIYLILYKIILSKIILIKIKKTLIVFIMFILLTPIMPVYKNMNFHINYLNNNSMNVDGNSDAATNLILYGRENYLSMMKDSMKKSEISNKLFGLGKVIKNNNSDFKYYEAEMDLHNLYYCYGIIGIIIFFIPQVYIFTILIKQFFKKGFKIINDKIFLLGVGVAIAYLVSFMAGHTLLAVSPATYLAYFVSFLCLFVLKKRVKKKKRVMFISSVGGHLTQLLEFKKIFNDYNYILITEKTNVTKDMKNKYNMKFLPYGSRNQKFSYPFILLFNCIKSFIYLLKYNPDVIITTGANTAAAMCCFGKIFGKKVIYIESFAKRTSPTVTGKCIYKLRAYTVFVVQWESMLEVYPKAQYWGGIY